MTQVVQADIFKSRRTADGVPARPDFQMTVAAREQVVTPCPLLHLGQQLQCGSRQRYVMVELLFRAARRFCPCTGLEVELIPLGRQDLGLSGTGQYQ